jgi:hypothetical protein
VKARIGLGELGDRGGKVGFGIDPVGHQAQSFYK